MRWLHVCLSCALVTLLSLRVLAQEPAGLAPYEEVLAEAIQAFDSEDWPLACDKFEQAHALYPNARTLRGIGVAAFAMGANVRAVHALAAALAHPERPLSADLRELTELLLAKARARVVVLRVEVPADATLCVDGVAAVREPDGTVLVDPGEHSLRAEAADFLPATHNVQAQLGVEEVVRMELTPEAKQERTVIGPSLALSASAPVLVRPSPLRVLRADELEAPNRLRSWAWGTLSLAGAGLVSAGTIMWIAKHRNEAIRSDCAAMERGCERAYADRRLEAAHMSRLQRGVNASLGIAAGAAVTAAVLWSVKLWAPRKVSAHVTPRGVAF